MDVTSYAAASAGGLEFAVPVPAVAFLDHLLGMCTYLGGDGLTGSTRSNILRWVLERVLWDPAYRLHFGLCSFTQGNGRNWQLRPSFPLVVWLRITDKLQHVISNIICLRLGGNEQRLTAYKAWHYRDRRPPVRVSYIG